MLSRQAARVGQAGLAAVRDEKMEQTEIQLIDRTRNYGGTGYAVIGKTTCDACGLEKVCVITDTSMGEYGDVCLCFDCIQNAINRYIRLYL